MKILVFIGVFISAIVLGDNIYTMASDSYKEVSATVEEISIYEDLALCTGDDGITYRVVLSSLDKPKKGEVITLYKSCNNLTPSITGFCSKDSARASSVVFSIVGGIFLVAFLFGGIYMCIQERRD